MSRLKGKRCLITQCDAFMGQDLIVQFEKEGAEVIKDYSDLTDPAAADLLIKETGHIDILIVNLAATQPRTSVLDTDDATFISMYEKMVYPLHRLTRAVLPQMIERQSGKIVVMGSASALKGMPNYSAYGSARGAQLSYVQDVGVEMACHNIQLNAMAQTFVENETYFPKSYQNTPEFKDRIKAAPVGRLAHGWESASLALFLASDESNFFVGQVIPFAGGWVT